MAEDSFGARLRAALKAKGWYQSDLVRETGLDKNTVSALVNDKQRANPTTIGRIETALGVTLDTPVGAGEDHQGSAAPLAEVGTDELLAELTYRMSSLRKENEAFRAALQAAAPRAGVPVGTKTAEWFVEFMMRHPDVGSDVLAALDAGQAEAQKNPDDDGGAGARVTPIRPDDGGGDGAYQPIAARRGRSRGRQLDAEYDRLGEESQDDGGEGPA